MIKQNSKPIYGRKTSISLPILAMFITFLIGATSSHWTARGPDATVVPSLRAAPLQGPPFPWSSVGSTGTVDESIPSTRYAFTDACVEYSPTTTSVSPIELRYNVVNTNHTGANAATPGWTILELGAAAPGTSVVEAILYRVDRCTGTQVAICGVKGVNSPNPDCTRCQFPAGAVDFSRFLYYVRLTLARNTTAEKPRACTLRVL